MHFFTSHFYTTLKEEGVNAVSSWTSRKGIDIFSKRIIFLPINQTLHWSLCAVINPGYVENFIDTAEEDSVRGKNILFHFQNLDYFALSSLQLA